MNQKKQASPAVIVAMVAGILIAIVFIIKGISDASGGGGGVSTPPAVSSAAPEQGASAETQAAEPGEPAAEPVRQQEASTESVLKPSADPFSPLPYRPALSPPTQGSGIALQPSAPSPGSQPLPTMASAGGAAQLLNPLDVRSAAGGSSATFTPLPKPEPPKAPELAGTMLGDHPSAVFRDTSELVVVPVGGRFKGWTVVSVKHGEVAVRRDARLVRLGIGPASGGAIIREYAPVPPRPATRQEVARAEPADSAALAEAPGDVVPPPHAEAPQDPAAGDDPFAQAASEPAAPAEPDVMPAAPVDGPDTPIRLASSVMDISTPFDGHSKAALPPAPPPLPAPPPPPIVENTERALPDTRTPRVQPIRKKARKKAPAGVVKRVRRVPAPPAPQDYLGTPPGSDPFLNPRPAGR